MKLLKDVLVNAQLFFTVVLFEFCNHYPKVEHTMQHNHHGPYATFLKRVLDCFLASLTVIFLSPVLLIVALLVRIKLGSPVFFRQKRPGIIDPKTGKETFFPLYKFRTMTDERGEDGKLLPDTIRLTKFGCLLRSTSLDELPELFNIIKGDMSIVGPRPLAVIYLNYYTKREHRRHTVRPGLTGWAQVNGRNSISWEDKFAFDLEYIENLSFLLDLKIILLTIKKVFVREGIGQGEEAPVSLHILRANWLNEDGSLKPEYEEE